MIDAAQSLSAVLRDLAEWSNAEAETTESVNVSVSKPTVQAEYFD